MKLTYVASLILILLLGVAIGYYVAVIAVPPHTEVLERVVVVDSLGRYVRIGNVSRVVSLGPSISEIVFALGLEDYLVGVDDFSNYPGKLLDLINSGRVKYVGSWWSPDIERVVALRPSLVLADGGVYRQVMLRSKFEELGISVLYLRGSSCRDVYDVVSDIKLVGMVFNVSGRAEELSSYIIGSVNNISKKVLSVNVSKPKVLVLLGPPSLGLYTAGGNTFVGYVIEVSGGINIARGLSGWPQLSYEAILSEDPDVILITSMGDVNLSSMREELLGTPLSMTKAFREGRVYLLTGEANDMLVRPGPRIHLIVDIMSKLLYPEVFGVVGRSDVYKVLG
ncbi:MAG: helical backbone metal receptor [Sulfolobales archaeon]